MLLSNEDRFNLIYSAYPWILKLVKYFIEFGGFDIPINQIPAFDFHVYEKLSALLEIEAKKIRKTMRLLECPWIDVSHTPEANEAIQAAVLKAMCDEDGDGEDGAPPPPPAM